MRPCLPVSVAAAGRSWRTHTRQRAIWKRINWNELDAGDRRRDEPIGCDMWRRPTDGQTATDDPTLRRNSRRSVRVSVCLLCIPSDAALACRRWPTQPYTDTVSTFRSDSGVSLDFFLQSLRDDHCGGVEGFRGFQLAPEPCATWRWISFH